MSSGIGGNDPERDYAPARDSQPIATATPYEYGVPRRISGALAMCPVPLDSEVACFGPTEKLEIRGLQLLNGPDTEGDSALTQNPQ